MNNSAKEMFEELGFKKSCDDNYEISYYNEQNDYYIYFYKYSKKIEVLHDITKEELQAINQQCIEKYLKCQRSEIYD